MKKGDTDKEKITLFRGKSIYKTIRITLVILILIFLVPAYTSAERIDKDGNEYRSYQTCSKCGDSTSCSQIPLTSYQIKLEDNDFLSWEGNYVPVLEAGPGGSWDDDGVLGPEVLYTGTQYMMWYSGVSGTTFQIGYATSYNGLTWEKSSENPVLPVGEPGRWDEKKVWAPAVVYNGSTWEMWYTGYSDVTGSQIGYATSEDGINWVKYWGNPVFTPGIFDEWESSGVTSPYVIFENGVYHMWYSNDPHGSIGYAASSDGIHWERYPENPIIQPYGGDEFCEPYQFVSPAVVHLDEYHMWYQAGKLCRGGTGGYHIVHSISSDRIIWSDPERAYGSGGIWSAHYPTVISHHNGLLKQMWYVHCSKTYYAEENQLDLRNFLPLTMR